MRRKALFYLLLALATVGLSQLLQAWHRWRFAPSLEGGAEVVLVGCALVAVMLWLGFLLYEVDRATGQVRRRIGLYEWVLARGTAGRRPGVPTADPWAGASTTGPAGAGKR